MKTYDYSFTADKVKQLLNINTNIECFEIVNKYIIVTIGDISRRFNKPLWQQSGNDMFDTLFIYIRSFYEDIIEGNV
jgi:hypothetical protein